jgi:mRNA degradation ribonuclease J1/J2
LGFQVYAPKLTIGPVGVKLRERRILVRASEVVEPGKPIRAGAFEVEFLHINQYPRRDELYCTAGIVVNTSDYKIDYTPLMSRRTSAAGAHRRRRRTRACGDSTRSRATRLRARHWPDLRDLIAGAEAA